MKIILLSILSAFVLFFFYLIVLDIDKNTGSELFKSYTVKSDCDFKLPNQYYLVKDSITSEYAIMFTHFGRPRNFLRVTRYNMIDNFYSDMSEAIDATIFKDSCKAKGFFKLYIVSKQKLSASIKNDADRFK